MRIINKDLTKEVVQLYVSSNQIYAKIFHKENGKWSTSTYFQAYDFSIDEELITSTVKYIKHTWDLKDPKVIIE